MSSNRDDVTVHVHVHDETDQPRTVAVHVHFHGAPYAGDRQGDQRRRQKYVEVHEVLTPAEDPVPAKDNGSSGAVICVRGQVNDPDLWFGKAYAAIYRTEAECPEFAPTGAASGNINGSGAYQIDEVGNVQLGSGQANWLCVWVYTPSGVKRHPRTLPFTAVSSTKTFCETNPVGQSVATALASADTYTVRAASADEVAAAWLAEPVELQRASSGDACCSQLWKASHKVDLTLHVFHTEQGWEAELILCGAASGKCDQPLLWRAARFLPDDRTVFYLSTRESAAACHLIVEPK